MIWPWIYLAVIGVSGYTLTSLLTAAKQRVHIAELIGMSAIFGCGIVSSILIWLSMCGVKPSRAIILWIGMIGLGAIGFLWKIGQTPSVKRPFASHLRFSDITLLGLAGLLIAVQLACVAVVAIKLPVLDIDGWAIWGTKAKVLYYESLRPTPAYFHDLSLSYSHLDYPLIVPMLWTGEIVASGNVNDPANKAVVLIPLIGAMLLLYGAAREGLSSPQAGLIVSLFAGAPAMSRWSGQGQADMVMAAFILAVAIWFMKWIRDHHLRHAIATGFFIAVASSTKLEGIVLFVSILGYAILMFFWTLIHNRPVRSLISGMILIFGSALLVSGPWLLWSRDLPHTHEDYGSRINASVISEGFGHIPQLIDLMSEQFRNMSWIPIILITVLSAVIGSNGWTRSEVRAGWFIVAVQLAAYLVVYLITPWNLPVLIPITAPRLLLQVTPLAMLLVGMHWSTVQSEPRQ